MSNSRKLADNWVTTIGDRSSRGKNYSKKAQLHETGRVEGERDIINPIQTQQAFETHRNRTYNADWIGFVTFLYKSTPC